MKLNSLKIKQDCIVEGPLQCTATARGCQKLYNVRLTSLNDTFSYIPIKRYIKMNSELKAL